MKKVLIGEVNKNTTLEEVKILSKKNKGALVQKELKIHKNGKMYSNELWS
jgi:hypothetical protein